MAILPLVIAPDPRLKIPSQPVVVVDDATRKFMDDMLETMYASNGIGLAAVQVGVHQRILVMDIDAGKNGEEDEFGRKVLKPVNPMFLVNPEVTDASQEMNVYEEGCLSFPGQYAEVERPKIVRVKYLDYDGKPQEMLCDELLSTCIQHEMDHLNGIVFVDHISRLKREMIMKKLTKMKKLGDA